MLLFNIYAIIIINCFAVKIIYVFYYLSVEPFFSALWLIFNNHLVF